MRVVHGSLNRTSRVNLRPIATILMVSFALLAVGCGPQRTGEDNGVVAQTKPLIDPALLTPAVREKLSDVVADALLYGTGHEFSALYPDEKPSPHDVGFLDFDKLHRMCGYPRIAREQLSEEGAKLFVEALIDSAAAPDPGFTIFCFLPRHALSIQHHGRRVDVLICFQCSHVYAYVDSKNVASWHPTKPLAAAIDQLQRDTGLPSYIDSQIRKDRWAEPSAPVIAKMRLAAGLTNPQSDHVSSRAVSILGPDAALAFVSGPLVLYRLESADAPGRAKASAAKLPSGRQKEVRGQPVSGLKVIKYTSNLGEASDAMKMLTLLAGGHDEIPRLSSYDWPLQCGESAYALCFGTGSDSFELVIDKEHLSARLYRVGSEDVKWFSTLDPLRKELDGVLAAK